MRVLTSMVLLPLPAFPMAIQTAVRAFSVALKTWADLLDHLHLRNVPVHYLPTLYLLLALFEVDIQAKCFEFLDQNVKGLRNTDLEIVFTANDGLIHFRASGNVIGFDR